MQLSRLTLLVELIDICSLHTTLTIDICLIVIRTHCLFDRHFYHRHALREREWNRDKQALSRSIITHCTQPLTINPFSCLAGIFTTVMLCENANGIVTNTPAIDRLQGNIG
jgi:hypothetical protein